MVAYQTKRQQGEADPDTVLDVLAHELSVWPALEDWTRDQIDFLARQVHGHLARRYAFRALTAAGFVAERPTVDPADVLEAIVEAVRAWPTLLAWSDDEVEALGYHVRGNLMMVFDVLARGGEEGER